MATNYPGSLDSFSTRSNGQANLIDASHINNLQDSVVAVETALGTNPKGTAADVSARIAAFETAWMQWSAEDQGFVAWSYDAAFTTANQLLVNGSVYLSSIAVRRSTSITALWYGASTAGATPTTGQNFIGLYNSSGTRLAQLGIDSNVTNSNGPQKCVISSTALTAGRYWVALVFNAATAPTVLRTSGSFTSQNVANTSGATLRFAINGTSQTSLPASITPASNTTGSSIWVAVS